MLKLNASYAKKVPVDGQDFSSQSYHASVEIELPDGLPPDQLTTRIHETFDLVRRSVEAELKNGHPATASAPTPTASRPQPQSQPRNDAGTASAPAKASSKQVKFLSDLALRNRMDLRTLNAEVQKRFGVGDIAALTRKQASGLIDHFDDLVGEQRRAA